MRGGGGGEGGSGGRALSLFSATSHQTGLNSRRDTISLPAAAAATFLSPHLRHASLHPPPPPPIYQDSGLYLPETVHPFTSSQWRWGPVTGCWERRGTQGQVGYLPLPVHAHTSQHAPGRPLRGRLFTDGALPTSPTSRASPASHLRLQLTFDRHHKEPAYIYTPQVEIITHGLTGNS